MSPKTKERTSFYVPRRAMLQFIIMVLSIVAASVGIVFIFAGSPARETRKSLEIRGLETRVVELESELSEVRGEHRVVREEFDGLKRKVEVLEQTQSDFISGAGDRSGPRFGYTDFSQYKELLSDVNELTDKIDYIETGKLKKVEADTEAIKEIIGEDPLTAVSVIILKKELDGFKEVQDTKLLGLETRIEKYHASIYWILGIISVAVVGALIQGFIQLGIQIRRGREQG